MAMWVLTALAMLPVLLARLPRGWVALADGREWAVRAVLGVGVLWLASWARALLYARLPRSTYLAGRTLVVVDRDQKRQIDIREIEEVFVRLRPPPVDQAFGVRLQTGEELEVCPVHWPGAGRLYARLERKRRKVG